MNQPRSRKDHSDRQTAPRTQDKKTWTRPDFTEVATCAEICAYVFAK